MESKLVISNSGKLAHTVKLWTRGNAKVGGRVLTTCGARMIAFKVTREKCAANGWTVCESCAARAN